MSKYDKLISKMKNNPKNVSFEELEKILQNEEFKGVNTGEIHWVFRKDGHQSITIPYKRPIKIIYIRVIK